MQLKAVRGATTVASNDPQQIKTRICELIEQLVLLNHIEVSSIVSVFFTQTPDVTAYNPAKAIREGIPSWSSVAMLCFQEAEVEGGLPLCIRVLIQWHDSLEKPVFPCYLHQATQLRPDIIGGYLT